MSRDIVNRKKNFELFGTADIEQTEDCGQERAEELKKEADIRVGRMLEESTRESFELLLGGPAYRLGCELAGVEPLTNGLENEMLHDQLLERLAVWLNGTDSHDSWQELQLFLTEKADEIKLKGDIAQIRYEYLAWVEYDLRYNPWWLDDHYLYMTSYEKKRLFLHALECDFWLALHGIATGEPPSDPQAEISKTTASMQHGMVQFTSFMEKGVDEHGYPSFKEIFAGLEEDERESLRQELLSTSHEYYEPLTGRPMYGLLCHWHGIEPRPANLENAEFYNGLLEQLIHYVKRYDDQLPDCDQRKHSEEFQRFLTDNRDRINQECEESNRGQISIGMSDYIQPFAYYYETVKGYGECSEMLLFAERQFWGHIVNAASGEKDATGRSHQANLSYHLTRITNREYKHIYALEKVLAVVETDS